MVEDCIVEDWVLLEAAERSGWPTRLGVGYWGHCYTINKVFRALCDMIAKYEQPPVDPDVRLVADIVNAFQGDQWPGDDVAMSILLTNDLTRAVAVYKASKA